MSQLISFIYEYFFVYIWLISTTFVNIIAPTPGSTVVNPVTAFFTDPQRAIGMAGLLFFFAGIHRVYLFRRELLSDKSNLKTFRLMLPFSVAGAIAGGFLISYLNTKLLVAAIIIVSIYFIYKTIKQIISNKKIERKEMGLGFIFISITTGFLQGSGMPGSDMRNNYLRSKMTELSVRAVSSAVGLVNFLISGLIIFFNNKLTNNDLLFVFTIIPFLLLAQVYGKKFLDKMEDKNAKILAVSLSLVGVILLTYKYFL